ncbi:protein ELFN1 [Oryzias latipes]|uniref:LRRCT domain-containing protein n=1 Tax=Oryzias latipes TaxID=8090 RepID=A0A3B3HT23_ORYLA|nr:protein ELFN1 [Oryzias latipes]XP_011476182.1 protein ELFN1 [Oryzias latipes]
MASVSARHSLMATAMTSQMAQSTGRQRHCTAGGSSSGILSTACPFLCWLALLSVFRLPVATAECWLIEGEKGFVWLAICSMNQPPYEAIPSHINSTIVDLRLNENKIRSIHYSSLSRFGNLTYLNLTKNDISYVEDGAFSALFNLQVLQMGFNKLRNLTEGMLRGLGKLQYLYLQANVIETVTPNTFWECPNIENIDLSMNRIQMLDGSLFSGLSKLTTCELYTNPFNCSCELLAFLRWLAAFPNRTTERMVCDSPPGFSGYNLLSQNPRMPTQRNALHVLSLVCTDDGSSVTPFYILDSTTMSPDCGLDDCASGIPPEDVTNPSPTSSDPKLRMRVKYVQHSSAVITVEIPHPYKKMYILMLYNNSFFTDIQNLKKQIEDVELKDLKPNTNYTYCVASIRNSLRFNHTCLIVSTGRREGAEHLPNQFSATHYIMTIVGCLFGMLLFLGLIVHGLRKRKKMEEKEKKMSRIQRTLKELKYGGEGDIEGGSGECVSQNLAGGDSMSRMPYLPQGAEIDPYKLQEVKETPGHKSAKLNYMDVRSPGIEREISPQENPQGSVAEISTIAKEVDKVNQIINNCIDALKSESTSFQQGIKSPSSSGGGAVSTAEPQLVLLSEQGERGERGGEFLSPVYKGGRGGKDERGRSYHHSLQRHHSIEAPPTSKRPSTSSSPGSARSPRSFRSEGGYHSSESRYIERASPGERGERGERGGGDCIRTITPAAVILRAEAQRIRQYNEHRHSYPGSQQHFQELQHHPQILQELHHQSGARKPSMLDPLTLSRQAKQRELAYSQLSPHYPLSPEYHNLSYCSSTEEDEEEEGLLCTPTLGLWERFKSHRKRHRQSSMEDEGYVAAGHALRRKVQFAKDEDLHDILDYWKGVSAQQKA